MRTRLRKRSRILSWFARPKQSSLQMSRLSQGPPDQSSVPKEMQIGTIRGHDVFEIDVKALQSHYERRNFSCSEYVEFCLRQIHKFDQYLEAVIEVNPDAASIAKQLDDEREAGGSRGPLYGVPVLVKDNMATKDAMQTTAGSWALLGSIVPQDATIVGLLRKAGAIIIGHANMSELASCRSRGVFNWL